MKAFELSFIHHSSLRIHHSNLNAPRTVTRAARPATDALRLLPCRSGLLAASSPACRAAFAFRATLRRARAAFETRDLGGHEMSPLTDGQTFEFDGADLHAAEL